jgi:hypothetical protein
MTTADERTHEPNLILREAAMQANARQAVLQSGDLVTAVQVAEAAGLSARRSSAQTTAWVKQGRLFAIRHDGVDYFPGYALDDDYRPLEVVSEVVKAFETKKDGWGLAYWLHSDNSFLGGARPQDLLRDDPEGVVAAARDEAQEVANG